MLRQILAVSSSRGDARALGRIVEALDADAAVRVLVADVAEPFWAHPVVVAPTGMDHATTAADLVSAGHRLAAAVVDEVSSRRPDLLLLHGDRHELLPVAHAAVLLGLPLVHLGGGDLTEGAFDDSIRHALTKLAHLHLCTTEAAARRVRGLGEEEWRVVVTGEPALDGIAEAARAVGGRAEIERHLGFTLGRPLGILTYHPPTSTPERMATELSALVCGSSALATIVATHPAVEPGAPWIVAALDSAAAAREGFHVVPRLGDLYPALLAEADVVLGNSSSGIVEAASFGTPVIDIGDRQRGRLRPDNVDHVAGGTAEVADAIARALSPGRREGLSGRPNPYGDGHAAERAARAILDAPLERLLRKRFCPDAA